MKRLTLALIITAACSFAGADQWVNGYTKKDGTVVQGHHRSDGNSIKYDNYSSQGNSNPYTGQQGSQRNEFSSPPSYNKSYGGSKTPCYFNCKDD